MKVSKDEVIRIAELAKLKLTEEEIVKFQIELSKILEYVEQLKEIDTKGVKHLYHPISRVNIFREDKVTKSIDREEALSNAPERTEEFFKVPKVM